MFEIFPGAHWVILVVIFLFAGLGICKVFKNAILWRKVKEVFLPCIYPLAYFWVFCLKTTANLVTCGRIKALVRVRDAPSRPELRLSQFFGQYSPVPQTGHSNTSSSINSTGPPTGYRTCTSALYESSLSLSAYLETPVQTDYPRTSATSNGDSCSISSHSGCFNTPEIPARESEETRTSPRTPRLKLSDVHLA